MLSLFLFGFWAAFFFGGGEGGVRGGLFRWISRIGQPFFFSYQKSSGRGRGGRPAPHPKKKNCFSDLRSNFCVFFGFGFKKKIVVFTKRDLDDKQTVKITTFIIKETINRTILNGTLTEIIRKFLISSSFLFFSFQVNSGVHHF